MPDESLLRIGPFSRASSLSVKALRSYHEAGLLVPAVVDPQTGYRSYSAAQLTDATVIRRLRQLDVPLEAIREVLEARDPVVTRKVLSEHGAVLEQRLAAMQRAIDELYVAVDAPATHTPAHLRREPARTALTLAATLRGEDFDTFLLRTGRVLAEAAASSGAVVDGPFGACYSTLMEDDVQDVTAFLPVAAAPLLPAAARSAGVRVGELPETTAAVLVHQGSYDDLDDTYRRLGAWVADNAVSSELPVRELYVVGAANSDEPADYRTELCWPVLDPQEAP